MADMKVELLDHVNIRTPDIQKTAQFYADVLGLKIRPPMGRGDAKTAAWMHDDQDRAVIHIGGPESHYPDDVPGEAPVIAEPGILRVHHIAFRCSGYRACADKVRALNVPCIANDVPEVGLRQLFIKDPNGVNLELNFFED